MKSSSTLKMPKRLWLPVFVFSIGFYLGSALCWAQGAKGLAACWLIVGVLVTLSFYLKSRSLWRRTQQIYALRDKILGDHV